MIGRLKFKMDELVEEILDRLPSEVFINKQTTFFDPAMGGGQFLKGVIKRLRKYHSDENIKGRIFGMEKSPFNVDCAKNQSKLIGTFWVGDHESEIHMKFKKFDIIIGNPPYQSEKSSPHSKSGSNIYPDIIEKSYNLCDNYLCMIIPARWFVLPSMSNFRKLMIEKYGISYIKHFDDSNFQNVAIGGGVCYFISQPGYQGKTLFESHKSNDSLNVDLFEFDIISNDIYKNKDLIQKVMAIIQCNGSMSSLYQNDQQIKSNDKRMKCDIDKNKILTSGMNYKYTEFDIIQKDCDKYRVCLERVNGGWNISNLHIEPPGVLTSQSIITFAFNTEQEAKNAMIYINSKFAHWLRLLCQMDMNFTSHVFKFIPILDFSSSWTDEEICEKLKLTTSQIDLIFNEKI
jgi:hypothetical protein